MNLCMFTGRIGKDFELRKSNSGKSVIDFSIAVNEGKDKTTWVNCQVWDDKADIMSRYFKPGKPVSVETRLKNEEWTDKTTGDKRRGVRFIVKDFSFVPGGLANGSDDDSVVTTDGDDEEKVVSKAPKTRARPRAKAEVEDVEVEELDDDIPF